MLRILSLVGLALMVVAVVGFYRMHALLTPNPLALAAQVAAVALMIWARVTFGGRSFHAAANPTEGGLVTSGPYRFIRHPIYTSICLFLLASTLSHVSFLSMAFLLLGFAGAGARIFTEETLLVQRYPEYRAYAATTKRMVPFLY